MRKAKSDIAKKPTGFVLGRQAFAAISAVEGLKLSAASEKRLKALESADFTPVERRQAVIQAYTPSKRRK